MATMASSNQHVHLLTFFTTMENQGNLIVKEPPHFDLELYINNYTGRTRFERLILIGQCSVPLCVDALKAAVIEAKRGKDIQRYRDAWECIRLAAPDEPEAKFDEAWVHATEKSNKTTIRQLELELKGYRNNLVKESIRMANRELGEHLENTGQLAAAFDAYHKMKPDATTLVHINDVNKRILKTLIQRRDWTSVSAHCGKLWTPITLSKIHDITAIEQTFQKMVSGLACLGLGKFEDAAKLFLDISDPSTCQSHDDIASVNDVAIYGGLLALATMDRDQLQTRVLDNKSFRNFLELEPHIRKAVSLFVQCRYSACLQILESHRADYLLDIYLQKHVESLFSLIRKKCIIQYLRAFSTVTLDTMKATFGKPDEDFVAELVTMIKNGELDARINTIDQTLTTVTTDARHATHVKAIEDIENYIKEASERIRRMGIIAADLEVKGSGRPPPGVAGGASGISDSLIDEFMSETSPGNEAQA